MIIRFTTADGAHAVADALERVGVAVEVYPVDVSEARPWYLDLSDAVELRRLDALKAERRRLYAEAFTTELPPTLIPPPSNGSLCVDPARSDSADHTREEPET